VKNLPVKNVALLIFTSVKFAKQHCYICKASKLTYKVKIARIVATQALASGHWAFLVVERCVV